MKEQHRHCYRTPSNCGVHEMEALMEEELSGLEEAIEI